MSIVLIAPTAYTANLYFGAYRAIRIFNVSLKSLTVNVFNATDAEITTILTFSNPSEYSFHLADAKQTLYLWQGEELTYIWSQLIKHPLEISPQSTIDTSNTIDVPEHRIQLVTATDQKEWYIEVSLEMSGPMVERTWLVFQM